MVDQVEKQKQLKKFEDSLKGMTIDELKKLEQEIIEEAEKIDKEVQEQTFKLPKENYDIVSSSIHII